jgi:hypothetical protein
MVVFFGESLSVSLLWWLNKWHIHNSFTATWYSADQRESKRQRVREKYAKMPVDNKAELMQRDGKLTSRKSLRENLLGIIQRTCLSSPPGFLALLYFPACEAATTALFNCRIFYMWTIIWSTLSGEQINTSITGTLQSALTQQQYPPLTRARTRIVDREDQFHSGLWEPDDPIHGIEDMIIVLASYLFLLDN